MRISTNMLFETGVNRLGSLQTALARTQEQISTGRRILTPSDDPVAAAQALGLHQAQDVNTQYGVNRQSARHNLNLQEEALKHVTSLIQDVQALVIEAGNPTQGDSERQFLATELKGRLEDLLGLANTDDGSGNYLFSGYQSTVKPFAREGGSVAYMGDQGQRTLQVGAGRTLALSDPGSQVFQSGKTGNGRFDVAAAAANTGSGVIAIGSDSSTATPASRYEIRFISETEFDVYDVGVDPEEQLSTGNVYASGETITVAGMKVEIRGEPAAGDVFALEPSQRQSVFKTIEDLITALETPATGDVGRAALTNSLGAAARNLSNALDSVLTTRASVGARLRELDTLDEQGTDRNLQYEATLAELEQLDYTKALTDLAKQKIILEAAQQSFVQATGLSLFKLL